MSVLLPLIAVASAALAQRLGLSPDDVSQYIQAIQGAPIEDDLDLESIVVVDDIDDINVEW